MYLLVARRDMRSAFHLMQLLGGSKRDSRTGHSLFAAWTWAHCSTLLSCHSLLPSSCCRRLELLKLRLQPVWHPFALLCQPLPRLRKVETLISRLQLLTTRLLQPASLLLPVLSRYERKSEPW